MFFSLRVILENVHFSLKALSMGAVARLKKTRGVIINQMKTVNLPDLAWNSLLSPIIGRLLYVSHEVRWALYEEGGRGRQ